jgi:Ca2+-binding RTX toxin-like protein
MRNTLSRFLRMETLEAREVPATLQVIHNSPYAVAATVDVYVNGNKLLDDFAFRSATPFVDVPTGVPLTVAVAPGNSKSAADAIFTQTVTLADKNYIAVAVGNPLSTGADKFGLSITDTGRKKADAADKVDVLVFHGAPDAPTVDVQARGVGTVVNDISFRQFAENGKYLSLTPADFKLDVTTADGLVNVRGFGADLSGGKGAAVTVLASGFVTPPANGKNDFQLLAAFADGKTALLPVLAPTVSGTNGQDAITVSESKGVVSVSVNGVAQKFLAATNQDITINALGGNDFINAFGVTIASLTVNGGAGDDTILGSERADRLNGGDGNDLILGFGGNDRIEGGNGDDILLGGQGDDFIRGGAGDDIIFDLFGKNDVNGGPGRDLVISR